MRCLMRAFTILLLLPSVEQKLGLESTGVYTICCAVPDPFQMRVSESGGPAPSAVPNRRKVPYVGVFERSLRTLGEAECQVCSGQTVQTTRCPRCFGGQPAIHAVCEEEWLMRHGKCMFCRLPVRKPLTPGAQPQETLWTWRC